MEGKSDSTRPAYLTLTTYVSPEIREAFYEIAEAEDRTAAAELRRLVERHVAEYDDLRAAA